MDYTKVREMEEVKEQSLENLNIFMLKADKLAELCSNAENLSYLYHYDYHRHPYWDFKLWKLVKPA